MVLWLTARKSTQQCDLCKQARKPHQVHPYSGHSICEECLRLIRDEGIELPENLNVAQGSSDTSKNTTT